MGEDYPHIPATEADDDIVIDHSPRRCGRRTITATVLLIVVIVVVAIALGVVLSNGSKGSGSSSTSSAGAITNPAAEALIETVALQGGAEFEDPTSYQSKALAFVMTGPAEFSEEHLIQRYALACIFYATSAVRTPYTDSVFGVNSVLEWITSTSWMTDTDVCLWYGITCDDVTGKVTKIELFSNRLTGSFPAETSLLEDSLNYLDLYNNFLVNVGDEGNAWLGELTNLEYLFYGTNGFQYDGIPTHINRLKKLLEYDCSYNLYFGPLTSNNFVDMPLLNYLSLGGNAYNTSIPETILSLSNLGWLYMEDCFLEGRLDEFLPRFQNIEELWIDMNPGITGSIPTNVDKLSKIESLSISKLSLTGTLPTEMGRLTSMIQMWLFGNALIGTIPTEYGSLQYLTLLQLHDNALTGTMPTQVCDNVDGLKFGSITVLTSDCLSEMDCTCCSTCY